MNETENIINNTVSVKDAMKQLDKAHHKILFILAGTQLVGAITDGDIRRYLLNCGKLEDNVLNAANLHPYSATSETAARKIFTIRNFFAVPIVDQENNLIEIIFKNEKRIDKKEPLHIPVVIMAGGKGARLDPYTRILPKPLIPIGELPIIEHIMKQFLAFDCDQFHIIVNYKKQLIKAYLAEADTTYNVKYYDEEKPLGTGGGLSLIKNNLDGTFFLSNCDIIVKENYANILKFHQENKNAITLVGAYKSITVPYGVIDIGENGYIQTMQEKPEFSFLTNTGLYVVESYVLEDIIENESIGFPDIICQQMRKGRKVAVFPVSENNWLDMGQFAELEQMRARLELSE